MTAAIAGNYNVWLVAVSVALAAFASYAALDLAGRVAAARGVIRAIWLGFGAVAMGLGIWSMHYVGMLAFQLPIAVAYDWPTVALSLLAAIAASAVALGIVGRPRLTPTYLVAGGLAMGAGITSMHYIGMEAMRLPAMCMYDPFRVGLSIVIAVVVSGVALQLAFRFREEQRAITVAKAGAACVMGAAVALMHYSGMAAVTFAPSTVPVDLGNSLVISSLALANIVAVTAVVLGLAILTAFVDRRLAAQIGELRHRDRRLARVADVSVKRGERIEALARVARDAESLSFGDRAEAILKIATAVIRPGRPVVGVLTHLDRGTIIIDSSEMMFGPNDASFDRISTILYPGSTFIVERTLHAELNRAGRTLFWNTIERPVVGESARLSEDFGINALIGTPVRVGSKTHFVAFEFLEPMIDDPFTEEDVAFVDVVASFLANGYQRQLQAERLSYQMEHDAMTGLGNRIQMRRAMAACAAAGDDFAFAVLNLDRFREINLTFGQLIGDELLVEVATELAAVDDRDLVSRRNGDEFAILMRGAGEADVAERVERYVQTFRTAFHTGDRDGTRMLSVGCSFGLACFPRDGRTIEAIMLRAEVALDLAKQRGNGVRFFDAEMEAMLARKWLDRGEIERALANDEFDLLYQPTFDLKTRQIVGAEGLVRWNHPARGLVMPGEFIDWAERNGMIRPLTLWVFDRLTRDLLAGEEFPAGVRIYMNLAAQQLDDPSFAILVEERLTGEPRLAGHIGFELTESGMMLNVRSSIETIERFRGLGIGIAIDDFGTGFSSLSYLKHLPADVIKIDQSFVRGIPGDEKDATLADTFIWLGNAFDFITLAEGIETEEQAAWLADHGCRRGQGFLVARALPFGAFRELMGIAGTRPALRR
jgi:diguanylate cyclase (GGDEF)-like protein